MQNKAFMPVGADTKDSAFVSLLIIRCDIFRTTRRSTLRGGSLKTSNLIIGECFGTDLSYSYKKGGYLSSAKYRRYKLIKFYNIYNEPNLLAPL
jgi:hypothetical protein